MISVLASVFNWRKNSRTGSRLKAARYVLILIMLGLLGAQASLAQSTDRRINVNVYGAIDYNLNHRNSMYNSFFTLGEQDFFVTSRISDRVSFLGETVVKFDAKTGTTFSASIERAQLKYDYSANGNHSLLVGKMHSPVNYWNDVYHHGRIFFPTIDRPISFSQFVPLHSMGMRLQGQNIGKSNFGYDLMVANGISSSDVSAVGSKMSYLASVHIKPVEGMRIQAGYYFEHLDENISGVHSGHSASNFSYKGPLDFNLLTLSFAYFNPKVEILSETVLNASRTDTLGVSRNMSSFLYVGRRLNDNSIPYVALDFISVSDAELHVAHLDQLFMGLGYRHEFTPQLNLKLQLMRLTDINFHTSQVPGPELNKYSFKIQLAYVL